MKVVLLSTLLLASLSARAELIEAQGSAAILGGEAIPQGKARGGV